MSKRHVINAQLPFITHPKPISEHFKFKIHCLFQPKILQPRLNLVCSKMSDYLTYLILPCFTFSKAMLSIPSIQRCISDWPVEPVALVNPLSESLDWRLSSILFLRWHVQVINKYAQFLAWSRTKHSLLSSTSFKISEHYFYNNEDNNVKIIIIIKYCKNTGNTTVHHSRTFLIPRIVFQVLPEW